MPLLHTELCDIVGIEHPILQGGMGPYKTESLATAVSNAGALGVISSIGMAATLLPDAAPVVRDVHERNNRSMRCRF